MYYLRTKAAADAIKFTVEQHAAEVPKSNDKTESREPLPENPMHTTGDASQQDLFSTPVNQSTLLQASEETENLALAQIACSLDNPEGCEMCGS
jgi:ribonucleoside-diphosphate reductase alpha chain